MIGDRPLPLGEERDPFSLPSIVMARTISRPELQSGRKENRLKRESDVDYSSPFKFKLLPVTLTRFLTPVRCHYSDLFVTESEGDFDKGF